MDSTVIIERIATAWLVLMGLAIGSFLNVVIYRLPRDLSIVSPRSACPKCGHMLPWYENIPVVSWLMLRGQCSQCKTPISARYAIVESLTALLYLACLARFGWSWELVSALTFVTLLVPLTFIDAELWVLPFSLTLPGILFGVLLMMPRGGEAVKTAIFAAILCFMLYRLLEWVGWLAFRKEALGAGDKYLLAMVGAFLGWRPLLGILFLSAAQGAVFGIASILINGRAGPEKAPSPEAADPIGASASETPTASTQINGTMADPVTSGEQPAAPAAVQLATPAEPEPTFTPDFAKPGLSIIKRIALVPWTLFLQPIPDDPPIDETTGDLPEWDPPTNALPFGPWIALAALEVMLVGPALVRFFEASALAPSLRIMFGS